MFETLVRLDNQAFAITYSFIDMYFIFHFFSFFLFFFHTHLYDPHNAITRTRQTLFLSDFKTDLPTNAYHCTTTDLRKIKNFFLNLATDWASRMTECSELVLPVILTTPSPSTHPSPNKTATWEAFSLLPGFSNKLKLILCHRPTTEPR